MGAEKRKPHFDLETFKRAFRTNGAMTESARDDAAKLEYLESDILRVVNRMRREDFVKSTTAHFDSTRWQDVYTDISQMNLLNKQDRGIPGNHEATCRRCLLSWPCASSALIRRGNAGKAKRMPFVPLRKDTPD
jgi:hypothetical protein